MSRALPGAAPTVGVVLLAAWVGASLFFAVVVAPAAFRVLPTRTLAGALVGGTLPMVFTSGVVAGLIAAALGVGAGGVTGRARAVSVICAMGTAVCCAIGVYLDHRIDAVRAGLPVALDALLPSDPLRQTFGRLHALSVLALGVAMILAVVALVALGRGTVVAARGTGTAVDTRPNC